MEESQQKKESKKENRRLPTSLFQLLIFLIKNLFKTLPQRIIIALITGLVVLFVHTYLMVVQNDGFRLDDNSKILKYILMLNDGWSFGKAGDGFRIMNVTLFWMLISALFWGTILQIRGLGFKLFLAKQIDNFAKLFSDIFEKPGSVLLSMFLSSICTGIVIGIIVSNPLVSILLSVFILMAVSARGTSFLLLIIYIAWCDFQRLFRVNPKKPFYIDIVSMVLRGVSVGLLVFSFTPYVKYGNVVQYIVLLAFIGLLILNITKKTKPNVAAFLFLLGSTLFISSIKAFADDGGWKESGGIFGEWAKSEGAWEAVKRGLQPALGALSMALGFVPIIGDAKDAQEAFTGKDWLTGEKIPTIGRLITFAAIFVPVVNGKMLRTGTELVGEGAEFIAKHGDEIADAVKKSDDIIDSTRFTAKQLLNNGKISIDDLKNMVPKRAVNKFKPSTTIKKGSKYNFKINGTSIELKWHSPDANAANKFPGSNSANEWTAQINVENRLLGQDGKFHKNPSNLTHIPVEGIK